MLRLLLLLLLLPLLLLLLVRRLLFLFCRSFATWHASHRPGGLQDPQQHEIDYPEGVRKSIPLEVCFFARCR